jgi:hypothetical protein
MALLTTFTKYCHWHVCRGRLIYSSLSLTLSLKFILVFPPFRKVSFKRFLPFIFCDQILIHYIAAVCATCLICRFVERGRQNTTL